MRIDDLLLRLDHIRQTARGWTARCPVPSHDDRHPSLAIREGDRSLLVKCWAGCTVEEIVGALGITMNDLFYDSKENRQASQTAQPRPWRFDWRRTSSDFLHHAEGLRLRAERVLGVARGLSTDEWSDTDRDAAMSAVCRVYGDLEWAAVLEDVAFDLRVRGLTEEKERHESRRRTTIEAA